MHLKSAHATTNTRLLGNDGKSNHCICRYLYFELFCQNTHSAACCVERDYRARLQLLPQRWRCLVGLGPDLHQEQCGYQEEARGERAGSRGHRSSATDLASSRSHQKIVSNECMVLEEICENEMLWNVHVHSAIIVYVSSSMYPMLQVRGFVVSLALPECFAICLWSSSRLRVLSCEACGASDLEKRRSWVISNTMKLGSLAGEVQPGQENVHLCYAVDGRTLLQGHDHTLSRVRAIPPPHHPLVCVKYQPSNPSAWASIPGTATSR